MINKLTTDLNHPIWIILTVLGIIGIVACIIIITMMKRQNDANNETLSKRWSDINKLTNENKLLQEKNEKIEEELINERNQTMMAREQLSTALQNNLNAEENYANQENDTNNKIAAARAQLDELIKSIGCRTTEMNELARQYQDESRKLLEVLDQQGVARRNVDELRVELDELMKEVNDAKLINRQCLMSAEENKKGWFSFRVSEREQRLISTIAEISSLYPELKKELATIEWKKVWLPQVQSWSSSINTRGIYRLVLKEDETVCYVGQAVNIKDRWYEHIKKMIGADSKGNERVYDYRPDEFYWTVVEEECNDLNSAERYWIEYYCCREKGLNRK